MANSLTDWLAAKVASCIQAPDTHSKALQDRQSLLEDIAFVRGAKGQINRFFAPQIIQEAQKEVQRLGGEPSRIDGQNGVEDRTNNSTPLWAIVADKSNFVHVQFSSPCVARFNSTKARQLISLRGAIISLKSFRPSVSFLPSLLDNRQHKSGPFAPLLPVRLNLLLEIESFEVLGSINEVTFWQANDLQATLLSKERDTPSFKQWFKMIEKITPREQHKVKKVKAEAGAMDMDLDPSSSNSKNSTNSSSGSASAAFMAETVVPSPYQRPTSRKQEEKEMNSQASFTVKKEKSAWGDFTLSQFDDEFGLDAAASQLIERHEQGLGNGQEEEARIADSFDRMFPPTTLDTTTTTGKNRESSQNKSTQKEQEDSSQAETLPATYPTNSNAQGSSNLEVSMGVLKEETISIRPRSVTENTSFPFSLLINEESLGPEAIRENKEIPKPNEEIAVKPLFASLTRVGQRSSRESSTQTEEVRSSSAPILGSQQHPAKTNDMASRRERGLTAAPIESSESTKWTNTIRKLTSEEIKERDRTHSSRIDLIAD